MNPPEFERCLEEIHRYFSNRDEVETAIAYGSVALGTAMKESDLDVFVIAPRSHHEEIAQRLYSIGALHGVTVSPYLVERSEVRSLDRQFIESVARDGIVLKGKPLDPTILELGLEPYQLVTLYLDHLSQKEKMQLSRMLYGYQSLRQYKGKNYRSRKQGFVEKVGGFKLGRGTFLIPSRAWPDLETLLRKHGGKRWGFTVWVQRH